MASNQAFPSERFLTVAPSSPSSVKSGQPCRFGKRVGVALTDLDSVTSDVAVDFGGVYSVSVKGTLADGTTGTTINAGDWVYFVDANAGTNGFLCAQGTGDGYLAGQALSGVASGATATINVAFLGVPGGASGASA